MARKWEKLRKKSEIFRFAHINHGSQIPIFGSDSKFDTRETIGKNFHLFLVT